MVEIKFENGKRAYATDQDKVIGESSFSGSDKIWIIDHTEVDPDYSGQGIARKLVDRVVEEARAQDKKLTATCPYALKVFSESPEEYKDVLI